MELAYVKRIFGRRSTLLRSFELPTVFPADGNSVLTIAPIPLANSSPRVRCAIILRLRNSGIMALIAARGGAQPRVLDNSSWKLRGVNPRIGELVQKPDRSIRASRFSLFRPRAADSECATAARSARVGRETIKA